MASSSSEDEPQAKRKRGITNEEKYTRSVIRKARVKGEGYKNYKGKMVPSKSVPDEIMCKCPGKCSISIDDETKNQIWNSFYSLDTKNNQDIYLQTLIEVREIKRRVKKKTKIKITVMLFQVKLHPQKQKISHLCTILRSMVFLLQFAKVFFYKSMEFLAIELEG